MHDRWYGGALRFRLLVAAGLAAGIVLERLLRVGDSSWFELVLSVLMAGILLAAFGRTAAGRVRRLRRRSRPLPPSWFALLPGHPLRVAGLRHIELRVGSVPNGRVSCNARDGEQAVIVIPPVAALSQGDGLLGLALHETAHLVRNDTSREVSLLVSGIALSFAVDAGHAVAQYTVLGVLLVGLWAQTWWSELRCDDAVRAQEPLAAAAYAELLFDIPRSARQRLLHAIADPPDRWRARRLLAHGSPTRPASPAAR